MKALAIVGGGPGGVSASLYAARAGAEVTLFTRGAGALSKAEKIENYYGLEAPLSGDALYARGLKQARALGVTVIETEVLSLTWDGDYRVETAAGEYAAGAVVLATGASRARANIPGLSALEGVGVSHCAVCDGFFFRGKDVAVLGSGPYALHEAGALLPICKSVTLLTNGAPLEIGLPEGLRADTRPIVRALGAKTLEGVLFDGGETLPLSGLFVALGVAGGTELAQKVGAPLENGRILVDENMATQLPGLYAAGDVTGGLRQIAQAAYQGAVAGVNAVRYLKGL